ncbi:cell division cycle 20.2, cofactor of APC complex-like [Phoenix dactylifera]|uniref:Cell division cycle 20.2, cofactor of APC complex-like n=1 Tax=Phoenix dactylifera TaxID=42345 RepID=A0A8B9A4A1_PHODC|nr:cell division cycle 20.2, cofactor of APC complex-like [Phoenix dactylifera]XP_038981456.1 cell division cycle 20.2, cofactor of APC complex-like [Phoenix dactylifera]
MDQRIPRYSMGSPLMRLREHQWSTPSSSRFAEPGDRFIPTRSLMNLDLAQSLLWERLQKKDDRPAILTARDEYRRKVREQLTLDSEGKPFRMLVFRGIPRRCKNVPLVEEMMQEEWERSRPFKPFRRISTTADSILDGPNLMDDYYLNLLDWGKSNILAVALGPSIYLRNAENGKVKLLLRANDEEDHPTSVAWSGDGKRLAVGFASSRIELWDVASSRQVRILEGHTSRVGSLSWNQNILTSGSLEASIINHDVRSIGRSVTRLQGHTDEVCGLRWSGAGDLLASGGNDNLVHVWESSSMGSSKYLHKFTDHCAAVRALAWCPFQSNILASGGGTADRCIKIWNARTGKCTKSIDTCAQVCALEWNKHQKEILSAHGYSQNQLSLWSYPSMSKIVDLRGHEARVLHLSQSPDGSTVASAAADESIRFWKVFEPPPSAFSRKRDEDDTSLLSLKRLHIR